MDKKQKDGLEQTSHKIIEKRRRDRINNCLSELSQTVPAAFSKQNSGKLEKAEILEMTVEYLRAIQSTEIGIRFESGEWFSSDIWADFIHHYQVGYNDCIREIQRFMTDVEGLNVNDDRCVRIISYLQTRFRPESSVSGGAAYRETMQRLLTSQSRRYQNRQLSRSDVQTNLPHHSTFLRYSPYLIPKLNNVIDDNNKIVGSSNVMIPPTVTFPKKITYSERNIFDQKLDKYFT